MWSDCGESVAEARAKGCIFDIMLNVWVLRTCYNQAVSEEYLYGVGKTLESGKPAFRFFADGFGYAELSLDEVRRGERRHVFTTPDHHLHHCA